MLIEETLQTCKQYLTNSLREESEDKRNNTYYRLTLHGKLRTVARLITYQKKGGVLQPEEYCAKSGEKVMEVLQSKRPDAPPPRPRLALTHNQANLRSLSELL